MSIEIFDDYRTRAISAKEVVEHIEVALITKKPFALVRISHAEGRMIGYVLGIKNQLKNFQYSGVNLKDFTGATKLVVKSIRHADIVGAGLKDYHHEFPLVQKILKHHNMKLPKLICSNKVNRKILNKSFSRLLKQYRVITIGRRAKEGVEKCKEKGINIVGAYHIDNFKEIEQVIKKIKKGPEFDIALIAAGINAKILAVKIKNELGKVAIDFGHGLDKMIDGRKFDLNQLHQTFLENKNRKQ